MVSDDPLLLFEGEHRFGKGERTHSEVRPCKRDSTERVSGSPKMWNNRISTRSLRSCNGGKAAVPSRGLVCIVVSELRRRPKPGKQGTFPCASDALPTGWPGAGVSPLTTPDPTLSPTLSFKARRGKDRHWKMGWNSRGSTVGHKRHDLTLHPDGPSANSPRVSPGAKL